MVCVQKAMQAIRKAMSKPCGVSLHTDKLGNTQHVLILEDSNNSNSRAHRRTDCTAKHINQGKVSPLPLSYSSYMFSALLPEESKRPLCTKPQQSLMVKVPKSCTKISRRNGRGSPVRIRA